MSQVLKRAAQFVATDSFYFNDELISSRGLTWDDPGAIDWERVKEEIDAVASDPSVELIIVDGIMVLDGCLDIYRAASFDHVIKR